MGQLSVSAHCAAWQVPFCGDVRGRDDFRASLVSPLYCNGCVSAAKRELVRGSGLAGSGSETPGFPQGSKPAVVAWVRPRARHSSRRRVNPFAVGGAGSIVLSGRSGSSVGWMISSSSVSTISRVCRGRSSQGVGPLGRRDLGPADLLAGAAVPVLPGAGSRFRLFPGRFGCRSFVRWPCLVRGGRTYGRFSLGQRSVQLLAPASGPSFPEWAGQRRGGLCWPAPPAAGR